jgi:hypothetical protein
LFELRCINTNSGPPPAYDHWGLPNTAALSLQHIPNNPRMDQEYAEPNPECLHTLSLEEALTFGSYIPWLKSHRIHGWMRNQDRHCIENTWDEINEAEEDTLGECDKEFIKGDIEVGLSEEPVQPWDSASCSWTQEDVFYYEVARHELEMEQEEEEERQRILNDSEIWPRRLHFSELNDVQREGW